MKRYPFLLLLAAPLAALAQTTVHEQRAVAVQPELQAELAPDARSYAYLALGGLRYTDYSSYPVSRTLGFDAGYLALGYEQQFAKASAWSWGPTLRLAATDSRSLAVQPGVLLRHLSTLGPLVLGQRLGAEVALNGESRLDPAYGIGAEYQDPSRVLLRLRLDLRPQNALPIGSALALSPHLSFEPALFLRLQKADGDLDKRTIDYTGLRGDVTLRFTKLWLDFTPFFALQTRYYRTIVQYDRNNVPTSNGRLNVLLPTAGLELRYHLPSVASAGSRFELPTQH